MNQALQYGGNGKVGLISLQKFWKLNSDLVASPLKIQYATDSGKVISRDTAKVEEPAGDLTIRAAAKHFGVNTADPSIDSPPIEIRANYTTNAPASHVANQANVGELADGYYAAKSTDELAAWLTKFFGMSASDAAAYASKVTF